MGEVFNHDNSNAQAPVADTEDARATLGEKIEQIAKDNHAIVFAENHLDKDNMNLITSPEVFDALAAGGVKHIMREGLGDTRSVVINAYIDDQITRDQFEDFIIDSVKMGTTGVGGIVFASEQELEQEILKLADQAKAADMHVHSLNRGEGLYSPEAMRLDHERDMEIGQRIVDAIQQTGSGHISEADLQAINDAVNSQEKYTGLDERIEAEVKQSNQDYADQAAKMYEENTFSVRDKAEEINAYPDVAIQNLKLQLWIQERVRQDELVAQNVEELSGGEKTALLYGAGHTVHKDGDLDAYLNEKGGAAVIALYNDKDSTFYGMPKYSDPETAFLPLQEPTVIDDILGVFGYSSFEDPDYELDYGKGTWKERGEAPQPIDNIPQFDAPVDRGDQLSQNTSPTDVFDGPYTTVIENAPLSGEPEINWDASDSFTLSGFYNETANPASETVRAIDPFTSPSDLNNDEAGLELSAHEQTHTEMRI